MIGNDDIPLAEAVEQVPRPVLRKAINDNAIVLHRWRRTFYVSRADVEWLRDLHSRRPNPSEIERNHDGQAC